MYIICFLYFYWFYLQIQLDAQRQHEKEMRELIIVDKNRAEAETAKLREELISTSAKVSEHIVAHLFKIKQTTFTLYNFIF